MEGYWKFHRKLQDSRLWLSEKFTRGQAWADLIGLANHEEGFVRKRGVKINVRRGEVAWSEDKLAERWKWGKGKVERFLAELIEDEMIDRRMDRRNLRLTSLISITNYKLYQGNGVKDGVKTDRRRGEDRSMDKNEKKNKEVLPKPPKKGERTREIDIKSGTPFAKWFKQLLKETGAGSVKADLSGWAEIYGQLIRIDKRTKDEVKAVCTWARNDDFWRSQFLSPVKLRRKNPEKVSYWDVFSTKMNNGVMPETDNPDLSHYYLYNSQKPIDGWKEAMNVCIADKTWWGDPAKTWEDIDSSNLGRMKKTGKLKLPEGVE